MIPALAALAALLAAAITLDARRFNRRLRRADRRRRLLTERFTRHDPAYQAELRHHANHPATFPKPR